MHRLKLVKIHATNEKCDPYNAGFTPTLENLENLEKPWKKIGSGKNLEKPWKTVENPGKPGKKILEKPGKMTLKGTYKLKCPYTEC